MTTARKSKEQKNRRKGGGRCGWVVSLEWTIMDTHTLHWVLRGRRRTSCPPETDWNILANMESVSSSRESSLKVPRYSPIGHFWLYLLQNLSYENEFDLHKDEPVGATHFNINGFTQRIILTQRHREIIQKEWSMKMILTYCYVLLTFMESLG